MIRPAANHRRGDRRGAGRARGAPGSLPPLLALLLVAALLWATACGSARRSEPFVGFHETDDPQLALGERVFFRDCSSCHPSGEGGLGIALNNKPYPRWLIRFQVRNGMGPMPSFSGGEIDDREMEALLDYVIWLRRRG